jgi:hypothetical protein
MPENKRRIPFKKRRDIAKKAKSAAGVYGARGRKNKVEGSTAKDYSETGVGRAIRKVTGGRKKVGRGTGQGAYVPTKPKFKKVQVQAKRFDKEGQTGESKTYDVKNRKEQVEKTAQAQREAGVSGVNGRSDVGDKEFAANKLEKANNPKYKKGARTKSQSKKDLEQEDVKRTYQKRYGQKRGSQKLKRKYKRDMKADFRAGKK